MTPTFDLRPNGTAGRQAHSAKAQSLTKDAIATLAVHHRCPSGIATALELKAKGLSLQAISPTGIAAGIADALNEEGYTTSRGTAWSKQALHKRLKAA